MQIDKLVALINLVRPHALYLCPTFNLSFPGHIVKINDEINDNWRRALDAREPKRLLFLIRKANSRMDQIIAMVTLQKNIYIQTAYSQNFSGPQKLYLPVYKFW
jgi:hypothetical protein